MDQSNDQVAHGRQDVWSVARAQVGAAFTKADIAHIMQTILTTSMPSRQFQQVLLTGPGGRKGGDEIHHRGGGLACFGDGMRELCHLRHLWPGEGKVSIHPSTDLDGAHLGASPPMINGLRFQRARRRIGKIGR